MKPFSKLPLAACAVLTVVLPLCAVPLHAQPGLEATERNLPTATKTAWATGLKDPQGLARSVDGKIFVAETGAGQVTGFDAQGAKLGTIGTGLEEPCGVTFAGDRLFVAERGTSRVLRLELDGTLAPLSAKLNAPNALTALPGTDFVIAVEDNRLVVAAGSVTANDNATGDVLYAAPADARRAVSYSAAVVDRDGVIYIADSGSGSVLLLTARGRLATWATGLKAPSGLAVATDGTVYVCEEGAGRIVKLSPEGKATPVIEGIGKPHALVFLDPKTLLVSDRKSGTLWSVTL